MILKTKEIKKSFFLLFLFLMFFMSIGVFAKDTIDSVILILEKHKENYKIYKQEEEYTFEKSNSSGDDKNDEIINSGKDKKEIFSDFNEFKIDWYVVLSFSGKTVKIYEQDLDWQWQKNENGLMGKTKFYDCPIELDYFYDENKQLKAKVSFVNMTGLPIYNLGYRFVVKYSKILPPKSEAFNLIKKIKTGDFSYNDDMKTGSIFSSINEFENKNTLILNMPVGIVAPDESSQLILNLF